MAYRAIALALLSIAFIEPALSFTVGQHFHAPAGVPPPQDTHHHHHHLGQVEKESSLTEPTQPRHTQHNHHEHASPTDTTSHKSALVDPASVHAAIRAFLTHIDDGGNFGMPTAGTPQTQTHEPGVHTISHLLSDPHLVTFPPAKRAMLIGKTLARHCKKQLGAMQALFGGLAPPPHSNYADLLASKEELKAKLQQLRKKWRTEKPSSERQTPRINVQALKRMHAGNMGKMGWFGFLAKTEGH